MILGIFLHSIYATVLAYIFAHAFGTLTPAIAGVSLVAGAVLGFKQAKRWLALHRDWRFWGFHENEVGGMELVLVFFLIYVAYRHFGWLLFPIDRQLATVSITNFGDLPMHVNYIRAFAKGLSFPPQNPEFAGLLLRYPFGPDLYNALWECLGVPLPGHLFAVGMVSTVMSLILLRSYSSWWGIGGFFLSGGLAGWEILSGSAWKDFQSHVDWKNLFLAVYLTQRGMLFALPLGLMVLITYRRHLTGEVRIGKRQLGWLGLTFGFLPLFHLHAFVALVLLLIAMEIEINGWRRLIDLIRSPFIQFMFIPGAFFVLRSVLGLRAQSVAGLSWGWTYKGDLRGFLAFLNLNFGPWLFIPPILAGALFLAKDEIEKSKLRRLWFEFGVYCLLFLFFFNYKLAPWEWDNIKLLIWPYLGFTRLLWIVVEPRLGALFGFLERPFIMGTLLLSGFVVVMGTLQTPADRKLTIYQMSDLANADGAIRAIPIDKVFASTQSHQHALTYWGRLRALGYEGHLWSHGIDYQPRADLMERLMNGDPEFRSIARDLRIDYIFWGPDERAKYGDKHLPFMDEFENVSSVRGYDVYAVK